MIRRTVSEAIRFCDNGLGLLSDQFFSLSPSLIIFTFHSLFMSHDEIKSGLVDSQQGITVEMFRQFISNFQACGYRFVTPREVIEGLGTKSKNVLITFDDGYYNNLRALPILEEFDVPAIFCVSTDYIETGKSFWWDVLYREAQKRKWPQARTDHVRDSYKLKRTPEVEGALTGEFGKKVFDPVSDVDRPMTATELANLAKHPLCHIGNHTSEHAILTNYSVAEIKQQISSAQNYIQRTTNAAPELIAYPNGNTSLQILRIARECGLRLGVTVQPGKNRIADIQHHHRGLALKRFTLWGDRQLEPQFRNARAAFSLANAISQLRMKSSLAFTL
jgi:peptidoglycan/xylan/chitin deacetylase (PgdA/CDA1 family)